MASTRSGERNGSNLSHSVDCDTLNGSNIKDHLSMPVSMSRKGLLSDEKSPKGFPENATSLSSRLKMLKISPKGKMTSSGGFHRISEDKDEVSGNAPLPGTGSFRKRFKDVMHKKIDWHSVRQSCKEWVRKPLNMALLLWIIGVAISGAILFLVMTGMLNHVIPKKSQRDEWFEVNNQIINALFTLMCLYQHPKRVYQLVLLCRWKNPEDIFRLRKIYCKNGTAKPNERAHLMVVITLLHVNCFAQYALCGLNLGYRRSKRPLIGVGICLLVAIAAPAIAGLYCVLSPLGKDYECDGYDEEAPNQLKKHQSLEKRYAFGERGIVVNQPEWKGGLFSLWEDFSVAYLSIFCCFCVFGWNLERLGFGNMYVHIATFVLFCSAPFWIFNLAAVNIDNDSVREILGITGIALCVFGLLYGGFWRIQMRKRFNLPANDSCFGKPNVADCVQWLCCCWCSLAQEVRTGDYYEIMQDPFYKENVYDNIHTPLTPLPREGRTASRSLADMSSSYWLNTNSSKIEPSVPVAETMVPPNPATMKIEVENLREI